MQVELPLFNSLPWVLFGPFDLVALAIAVATLLLAIRCPRSVPKARRAVWIAAIGFLLDRALTIYNVVIITLWKSRGADVALQDRFLALAFGIASDVAYAVAVVALLIALRIVFRSIERDANNPSKTVSYSGG